ncbi:MAG TPA: sulfur oxidation c-type cytochrome SoxA [Burkholderiales bacterium]|nr:sulfur oxidation c-type cytochrome SoxA [Burkholderiales bacterium]
MSPYTLARLRRWSAWLILLLSSVTAGENAAEEGGNPTAAPIGQRATDESSQKAVDEIAKYRQMLEEGNPAELTELQGEALWRTASGPQGASLEQCDLGLGPGNLDGAYARLPRYFADTDRVEDAESRLVTCMMQLQGYSREEATRDWYKPNSKIEALTTFVAARSKGHAIEVPATHPREAQMVRIGEEIFWRRSGPLDFACATCHSLDGRRIRLQDLPNFLTAEGAKSSMVTWPAYRVSQSAVWTMERRLIDCVRQMRWPEPDYLSEFLIALQIYLQNKADGAVMQGPGIKR